MEQAEPQVDQPKPNIARKDGNDGQKTSSDLVRQSSYNDPTEEEVKTQIKGEKIPEINKVSDDLENNDEDE